MTSPVMPAQTLPPRPMPAAAAPAPARPAGPNPAQMAAMAAARKQAMGGVGPRRAEGGPVKAKKYAKGGAISTGGSKGTTMKTTVKRQFTLAKAKGSPSAASRGDGCAQRGRTKAKIV